MMLKSFKKSPNYKKNIQFICIKYPIRSKYNSYNVGHNIVAYIY